MQALDSGAVPGEAGALIARLAESSDGDTQDVRMRLHALVKWAVGALCAVGLVVWWATTWSPGNAPATTPTSTFTAEPCPTEQERWLGDEFWERADVETVRIRLDCGAGIKQPATGARSPLHVAAGFTANPAVIQLLLNRGADIEAKGPFDTTPLHWAAANPNPAIARVLLDHGADTEVRRRDTGETPLHRAALEGNSAVIGELLDYGADIEAQTDQEWTPLHVATLSENPAAIRALLDHGADIEARDNSGTTSLLWAAVSENSTVIRVLLNYGADVEAPGSFGDLTFGTPLHWAARSNGNPEVIELLLDYGANVDEQGAFIDGTPLHWAANDNENPAVIRLLLDHGADTEARDALGRTPLDMATRANNVAAIQVLRAHSSSAATPKPAPAAPKSDVLVTRVVDGDTLEVRTENSVVEYIRLAHVDTPEKGCPHFQAATEFVQERAGGKTVRLQKPLDFPNRDPYGRLLREVLVEYQGRVINLGDELLAAGLAMRYEPGGPDCLPR